MAEKKSVFDFDKYNNFLQNWVKSKPKNGFGQLGKIAKHLNISSVSVSYLFNGKRAPSDEQAVELCAYLGLNEHESDYFILLIQKARAGSHKLEQRIEKQLSKSRAAAQELRTRVPEFKPFDEEAQATFYSQWYYSGIRLATSMEQAQDLNALAEFAKLPVERVRAIVDFLVRYGLCVEKNQKIEMGPQRTHVAADSPLAGRHHTNWRLKAIESVDCVENDELFFTGPMALSYEVFQEIRRQMTEMISSTTKLIAPSKSELFACMNVDLFKLRGHR